MSVIANIASVVCGPNHRREIKRVAARSLARREREGVHCLLSQQKTYDFSPFTERTEKKNIIRSGVELPSGIWRRAYWTDKKSADVSEQFPQVCSAYFFDPEDGHSIFLRSVGKHVQTIRRHIAQRSVLRPPPPKVSLSSVPPCREIKRSFTFIILEGLNSHSWVGFEADIFILLNFSKPMCWKRPGPNLAVQPSVVVSFHYPIMKSPTILLLFRC